MKNYFFILILISLGSLHGQNSKQDTVKIYLSELQTHIIGKEKEPAEAVFKNIQVLKGVPAGRMLKIMELGFSQSLGVGCDHCHDTKAWENDDKKQKLIARKMWNMAANIRKELGTIINEKATINCTTCHRGEVIPALNLK